MGLAELLASAEGRICKAGLPEAQADTLRVRLREYQEPSGVAVGDLVAFKEGFGWRGKDHDLDPMIVVATSLDGWPPQAVASNEKKRRHDTVIMYIDCSGSAVMDYVDSGFLVGWKAPIQTLDS